MKPFTPAEVGYLEEVRPFARMATIGPDGTPHVTLVSWALSADRQVLESGGTDLMQTQRFSDVRRSGRAAMVIDDVPQSGSPRGVEIRGRAEALTDPALIRIHPDQVISWGLDMSGSANGAAEAPGARDDASRVEVRMHAVVRRSAYEPTAVAAAGAQMAEFERLHASQPGYAGSVVVDVGHAERIMVTLWESEQHAARARSALTPVVRELLNPLERTPSQVLGVGPVIATDLRLQG